MTFFLSLAYLIYRWLLSLAVVFATALGLGIIVGLCARRRR